MSLASQRGFSVTRPYGDSDPYDVLLQRKGYFIRVQIKSAAHIHKRTKSYAVPLGRYGKGRPAMRYTPEEIDWLAVYVIPCDTWYLFPACIFAVKTRTYVRPDRKTHRYEPYREAWHLLDQPPQKKRCEDCEYGPKNVGDILAVAAPCDRCRPALRTL